MMATAAALGLDQEPRSLSERAYHSLLLLLTRNELAPGSIVSEKALVERLGIGRTPVREALQRLATEGLIVHMPNRCMLVSDINATTVRHIYEFRRLIDAEAVMLAASRASMRDVEELEAIKSEMLSRAASDDIDGYMELDRRFYQLIARAAQNVHLGEAIPRVFNLHLRLWFYLASKRGDWKDIVAAHVRMVEDVTAGIVTRDRERAADAIRSYIDDRHREIAEFL